MGLFGLKIVWLSVAGPKPCQRCGRASRYFVHPWLCGPSWCRQCMHEWEVR